MKAKRFSWLAPMALMFQLGGALAAPHPQQHDAAWQTISATRDVASMRHKSGEVTAIFTQAPLSRSVPDYAAEMARTARCEPPRPMAMAGTDFYAEGSVDGVACAIMIVTLPQGRVGIFFLRRVDSSRAIAPLAADMANSLTGRTAPAPPQQPAMVNVDHTALVAALDKVPAAHRPIAIIYLPGSKLVGDQLLSTMDPWMLFADGTATDCTSFDPRVTPPRRAATPQCDVSRWRTGTKGYDVLDRGTWQPQMWDYRATSLPKGQRYAAQLQSFGAVSNTTGGPGTFMAAAWTGRLNLYADGTYDTGHDRMYQSGTNRRDTSGGTSGKYHIDGYLMAMSDHTGGISIHFLAGLPENGHLTALHLDGTLYTQD